MTVERGGVSAALLSLSLPKNLSGKDRRTQQSVYKMIKKRKQGKLETLIAYAGIIITIGIAIFGYYIRTPYLYGQTEDGFIIRREVEAGTPVTLAYRHSVQKTMIYEYLAVNDSEDGLVLQSTKYQSLGVGLPFSKEEGEFRWEGEWFILDKINRKYPNLSIRNGVTNDERVIVGGHEYVLSELVPVGKELHIYVAPLWKGYWMKKEIRS